MFSSPGQSTYKVLLVRGEGGIRKCIHGKYNSANSDFVTSLAFATQLHKRTNFCGTHLLLVQRVGVQVSCRVYCIAASASTKPPPYWFLALKVAGEERREARDRGCTIRQRLTSTSGALPPIHTLGSGKELRLRKSVALFPSNTMSGAKKNSTKQNIHCTDPSYATYSLLLKTNIHPIPKTSLLYYYDHTRSYFSSIYSTKIYIKYA